jgi:uncharacterized protein YbjT (DUF2867 family)
MIMNIVLTGSLGNISRPLSKDLISKGHQVSVISSKAERQAQIEALGAKAAIGSVNDEDFLSRTFAGADIVYLMEPAEPNRLFNKKFNPYEHIKTIMTTYKKAVEQADVRKVVHLSSIGAHKDQGVGLLRYHFIAESILGSLPAEVAIKFMRPVGFQGNLLANIDVINTTSKGFVGAILALQYYGLGGLLRGQRGVMLGNYGEDVVNLMVSPNDIARVIAEEMEEPFVGRSVRYIASQEPTSQEVAKTLGKAIGKPYLKWGKISDKMLRSSMLKQGMNPVMVEGIVEMGIAVRSGELYEDYYQHQPVLGSTKLRDYAPAFAEAYKKSL